MQTIHNRLDLELASETMEKAYLLLGMLSDRCHNSANMVTELSGEGMEPEHALKISELLFELGYTLGFVSESLDGRKEQLCRCLESSN